jgi:hypothetical protein
MEQLSIKVNVVPKAKQSARFCARGGFIRSFQPKILTDWMQEEWLDKQKWFLVALLFITVIAWIDVLLIGNFNYYQFFVSSAIEVSLFAFGYWVGRGKK